PYRGAMVRASAKAVTRPAGRQSESDGEANLCPSLSCTIGTSEANRAALEQSIVFFHWNRMIASLEFREGQYGESTNREPMSLYHGTVNGSELGFAFEEAGFGDVVGLMVGPRERVTPSFTDGLSDDQLIEKRSDWSVAAFLWTGDEMVPFYL